MKSKHTTFVATAVLLLFLPLSVSAGVKYKVLHDFGNGTDGAGPSGPLLFDDGGNLYGVTGDGGTGQCSDYGCGTIYRLAPKINGTWKESILHSFEWGSDGAIPWGSLVFDQSGNLYGTLVGEPSSGHGVFELTHADQGWINNVLYTDAAGPGLLTDDLGNLYGEMGIGQDHGGAIGELSHDSDDGWSYSQVYSFCGQNSCPNGADPPTPPIWDGNGNMFGTTSFGGIYSKDCHPYYTLGCGTIYEMTPDGDGTWTYIVLHRFMQSSAADGQSPYSGLVMGKAGDFYGATVAGGAYGNGTIFKLAYTGGQWQETILYNFVNCHRGCGPEGTLARDKAGNLYGTADGGTGNCGYACGVVFKLSPQRNGKWKYSVVYNLTEKGGGFQPFYGVIVDDKGNLFGVTSQFGKYNFGTAFEITR